MLSDKARIFIKAGGGGNGCLSFRREAHVPRGGPDGGDGGRGGDVVLLCDGSLRDLQTFKRKAHWKAGRARHGEGALRHGAAGEDLVVRVPPGTQARLEDGTQYDLVVPGQRVVVARGGLGGRGNKHFATPTRQAPRFSERGLPGQEGWIDLQLKLLADVGLVGLPNAGKSSLLSRLTRAHPKVADYPFTTLEPVLGTLDADDRQLVLADIPGLIEGASGGAGLGHEFLAHVERTRLLVHVLDLAPLDGSDPAENYATVERELAAHDERLAALPRIVALSKADLVPPEDGERAAREWAERADSVVLTSSATGQGLDELRSELLRRVPAEAAEDVIDVEPLADHQVFRPAGDRGFTVERTGDGAFKVTGPRVERLLLRFDVENEEAAAHVEHRLDRMGVIRALEAQGFEPGDAVEIAGATFELDPGVVSVRVVKIGSSLVARDDGTLREDVLAAICDEVAKLPEVVVVTSGAIARGREIMGVPPTRLTTADLQALSAVGQGKLFPVYDALLRDRGRKTAQVLLTFHDMRERTHYLNARRTLARLLDWRIVPVINENDTTTTQEISFGDNDFLAAQAAVLLGATQLVLLTNTDGLYTANPATDPGAKLIDEVTDYAALEALTISDETSALGSGGMRSKVGAAEMASAGGIPTTICNGEAPGVLARVLGGEQLGTRFHPLPQRTSSFKLWLKYAKPSHGTVVVDAGAARALREGGTSLLPVGIVDVQGAFDAGDAVDVTTDGSTIGKGIVNFAADELRRIKGLQSAAVREIFPAAGEEAVHRDYFVLS